MNSLCLCLGILRSGSTWSYNVCRSLGKFSAMRMGEPFRAGFMGGRELDAWLKTEGMKPGGTTVIKAHDITYTVLAWLTTGRAKAVCTYRDPRDCVVSMLTFLGGDIGATCRRIADNFEYVRLCKEAGNTLFLRYEEIMAEPLGQIEQIARHLNVEVDPATLGQIEVANNLENTKKICDDLKNRPEKEVAISESHRVDRVTILHENHIFNAKIGRWKEELSEGQGKVITDFFRPWLVALGYEADAGGRFCKPLENLPAKGACGGEPEILAGE